MTSLPGPCIACKRYLMASGYHRDNLPDGERLHRAHAPGCSVRKALNPGVVTVFLDAPIADEAATEAKRLDRALSWMMQRAWKIAREQIKALPSQGSGE